MQNYEDPEEYYGMTTLMEHMLFNGSERFPDPADFDEFKRACPEWYESAYGFSAHKSCPIDFACLKAIKERATAFAEVRPAKRLCIRLPGCTDESLHVEG